MTVAWPSGKGDLQAGNIASSRNFASESAPRECELAFWQLLAHVEKLLRGPELDKHTTSGTVSMEARKPFVIDVGCLGGVAMVRELKQVRG